jgi:hypothetical protein
MKSTAVYAHLRTAFGPWFKSVGFKREKAFLSWTRPHGGAHVTVWFQISGDGWDDYAGSKFVVECQCSQETVVGKHALRRERLASILSQQEREEAWVIQNRVISSLPQPPRSHPFLNATPEIGASCRRKFALVSAPYDDKEDIWFRYHSTANLATWVDFISTKLPSLVNDVETRGQTT